MKIYFDNCSLQRPLDDKTQARIRIEAEAIEEILAFCETSTFMLVSSEVLQMEIDRNPNPQRRQIAKKTLEIAHNIVLLNKEIVKRAKEFETKGFKAIDALHLASAENEMVDYFCTCDDKFLKKAKEQDDLRVKVVSPLELAEEIL